MKRRMYMFQKGAMQIPKKIMGVGLMLLSIGLLFSIEFITVSFTQYNIVTGLLLLSAGYLLFQSGRRM